MTNNDVTNNNTAKNDTASTDTASTDTTDSPTDEGLGSRISQAVHTVANVVEYLRFGGLDTGEEPSPYDVMLRTPLVTLRRYFTAETRTSPDRDPVLLVPPLMLSADVWDVSPSTSAVAHLHNSGMDPWVVDFGDPAAEPNGLQRNVTDHVLAVSDAIDAVRRTTGRDVHIGGYSQGGLFCYQAAALRRTESIASIFALGSPMEPLSLPGLDLPEEIFSAISTLGIGVLSRTGLPGWASANLFSWTSPIATAKQRLQYLMALGDRDALLPRERQRRFLSNEGWIAFPGPAIAEVMESMTNDRFVRGGLVFDGRAVTMADITCPVLIFTGQYDAFAPPRAVRDVVKGLPHTEVWECTMPTGHFGLGVGSRANRETWPTVARWVGWIGGRNERPENLADAREVGLVEREPEGGGTVRQLLNAGTEGMLAAPGLARDVLGRATGTLAEVTTEAVNQVPRLLRLERVRGSTTVSYGGLLAEAYDRDPTAVCLLYRGRAHTRADVAREVDDLVLRLLWVGVRRGEHVGVLVDSGAVLLWTAAALSRIGAVAVLLRPGSDIAAELRIGRARRVLVDASHLDEVRKAGVRTHVIGGSGSSEKSGTAEKPSAAEKSSTAEDLDSIDTSAVRTPDWYRPNPGRGRDLGFVLFGDGPDGIRSIPVTNRRWALSAYGAASAAALTESDTVYSANALYHASGLLLATAAPVAVGARVALTDSFDPQTFWSDVRHYGATVVPYTWSMLRLLLDQPPGPDEAYHPVRLFIGSGIPTTVWRDALERFAPAQILEMFVPVRTDAILANVSGRKIGSIGRPLPGTARVELAAIDPDTGELRCDGEGYVRKAKRGDRGRLLVEVDRGHPHADDVPMRGVFDAHDAWVDTGEDFTVDAEGDFWPAGRSSDTITTQAGPLRPREVEDALARVPGVAAVAVITERRKVLAAIATKAGEVFDSGRARLVLEGVSDAAGRVEIVEVEAIPLTRWYRPDVPALRHLVTRAEQTV